MDPESERPGPESHCWQEQEPDAFAVEVLAAVAAKATCWPTETALQPEVESRFVRFPAEA